MRADQAEIAATVHFSAATLNAAKGKKPKEMDVLAE